MKNHIALTMAILSLGILAGCASLTQGTNQIITFHLQPETIKCAASRDGEAISTFNAEYNTLTVMKGRSDIIVRCIAPGYQTKLTKIVSVIQPIGVVGGIFIDYGLTDMATGAMWKYPSDVTIVLDKE